MYLPCPTCGQLRTRRVTLDKYSIGRALATNCPRCGQIELANRRKPGVPEANAAALADEIKFIGGTPEQVAKRLGSTPAAIARRFYRAGEPELARPFERANAATRRRRRAA